MTMKPAEILDRIQQLGATVTVQEGELRVKHPRSADAQIKALGSEITRYKPEIIKLLEDRPQPASERILGGHQVHRLIGETEKAVIFQDENSAFWRYLHDYRAAWPVVIESNHEECCEFLERILKY
jgi:hypothetical protein